MVAYVTLGTVDTAKSDTFYEATLATIGWLQQAEYAGWRAYSEGGREAGVTLWIGDPFNGERASAGNGTMVAFNAKSRAEVDAFYAAALAHGGTDEGAPGLRPHYSPTWYAAYVRDPSANKLAVVYDR